MKQYHIERSGEQYGPYSAEQILEMLQSNELSVSDNCWHDGLSEWAPLSSVLNLATPKESPTLITNAPNSTSTTYYYSSFGDRMGAYIIDIVIFNIVFFCIFLVAILALNSAGALNDTTFTCLQLSSILALWLYYSLLESSPLQATLGKKACRLIVADMAGNKISFWKASGRYFAMILSFATFGIGFIMCSFTQKRQCLHDIVAGCQVLKRSK